MPEIMTFFTIRGPVGCGSTIQQDGSKVGESVPETAQAYDYLRFMMNLLRVFGGWKFVVMEKAFFFHEQIDSFLFSHDKTCRGKFHLQQLA